MIQSDGNVPAGGQQALERVVDGVPLVVLDGARFLLPHTSTLYGVLDHGDVGNLYRDGLGHF